MKEVENIKLRNQKESKAIVNNLEATKYKLNKNKKFQNN